MGNPHICADKAKVHRYFFVFLLIVPMQVTMMTGPSPHEDDMEEPCMAMTMWPHSLCTAMWMWPCSPHTAVMTMRPKTIHAANDDVLTACVW